MLIDAGISTVGAFVTLPCQLSISITTAPRNGIATATTTSVTYEPNIIYGLLL